LHTVHGFVFEEKLVVFRNGDEEENCRDVLEAVDPLLSFRSLATHVEHAVCEIANDKGRLRDTGCLDTGPEHILIVRHIIGGGNTGNVVEVAEIVSRDSGPTSATRYDLLSGAVIKLVLSRPLETLLHATVLP